MEFISFCAVHRMFEKKKKNPNTRRHRLHYSEALFRISNSNSSVLSHWTRTIYSRVSAPMLWLVLINESDNWVLQSADEDKLSLHNDFHSLLFSSVFSRPPLPTHHLSSPPPQSQLPFAAVHLCQASAQHWWWFFTAQGFPRRPQRVSLNALVFTSDPKDKVVASVRVWLLAWHVNQLECFVFYRCLATICSKYLLVHELHNFWVSCNFELPLTSYSCAGDLLQIYIKASNLTLFEYFTKAVQ